MRNYVQEEFDFRRAFDESRAFETISGHWTRFMSETKAEKCVIGISGGIDSTCVAALACRIFGKDNVIGLSMPCVNQFDMADVDMVFEHLGIRRLDFNIGDAFNLVVNGISAAGLDPSEVMMTNLPARLRMATLYAFAQSIPGALVINTCNISESCQNYDTLFGDDCGSYAPIQELTKTEVRKLARWLGVPENLVTKTPIDGLQRYSDEDRFGYSYETVDKYIREGKAPNPDIESKIVARYVSGRFKMEMVRLPGPCFGFPNHLTLENVEEAAG